MKIKFVKVIKSTSNFVSDAHAAVLVHADL